MSNWHSRPVEALFSELESSAAGLNERQAVQRLQKVGPNELQPPKRANLLSRILAQMKDPMILVLLGAAALSLLASGGKEWLDAAIILVIVIVNNVISITQEDQAQHALEELQKLASPMARALRDGRQVKLEARMLVPGDVILLEAGDQVPADCRILECAALRCDESAMTGESVPVEKYVQGALPEQAPLGDWHNMVISGTLVTAGRGTALVCATGMNTQMGHIAGLLMEGEHQSTPLQRKMGEISKTLSFLCLCVCAVMFGVGLLEGKDMLDMFLIAVSLAVAAIPEGLPAIVTIVLAMGVGRMAERGAIIKKLPAVETLGCASVICSDKTGTLTQNKMTVQKLWMLPGGSRREALLCGCLCSDARLEWKAGAPTAQGDPTEGALVIAAAREGVDQGKMQEDFPRKGEIPFDSERKMMSTIHPVSGGAVVYVKGAPDLLLERCEYGPKGLLTTADRQKILRANEEMAGQAMRVLAVAKGTLKHIPSKPESWNVEQNLTFLGLFGLNDPPRKEVKAAVASCHQAGVRPVMITGDHKATAVAIAKELEICREGDLAITGAELDFMPQSLLEEDIERFSVFARVSPEHKMRIVQAWQKRGHIVAMTGDGVNDAPALKAADIGCAMGITGTDVAKGASDMTLTDDNFATIVDAVKEGRGIYANIKKVVAFLLGTNIGEFITVFFAMILWHKTPLLSMQLLWINLVTDSLPAIALGMEPVEKDIMNNKPRPKGEGIFAGGWGVRVVLQGIMFAVITLMGFRIGETTMGIEAGQTMAFMILSLSQIVQSFNMRSNHSLFKIGFFTNNKLNGAAALSLLLVLIILFTPLRVAFGLALLPAYMYLIALGLIIVPLVVMELSKLLGLISHKNG